VPFHALGHGFGHDPGVPVATVIDHHYVAHSGILQKCSSFLLHEAQRPLPSVDGLEVLDFWA
jgi:hypothetical protein